MFLISDCCASTENYGLISILQLIFLFLAEAFTASVVQYVNID